jgi:hypothetical protein
VARLAQNGLLVARCRAGRASLRATAPDFSRVLTADRCFADRLVPRRLASLRAAARIARLGQTRRPSLARRASFARDCSFVAARRLASTRPQFAQPDKPIANVSLRVAGLRLVEIGCARLVGDALPGLMCALVYICKRAA